VTLPLAEVKDDLIEFEQQIASADKRPITQQLVAYHGNRKARSFDVQRMPPSLYHRIVTSEVRSLLTNLFNGREPYHMDTIFLYADANSHQQPLHRDVGRTLLAPASLIVDITLATPTTKFIVGSHKDDEKTVEATGLVKEKRDFVQCGSEDSNAVLFSCTSIHYGSPTATKSRKIIFTFIPQPITKEEHDAFVEHSYAFGVSQFDKTKEGTTLPLIPLLQHSNTE